MRFGKAITFSGMATLLGGSSVWIACGGDDTPAKQLPDASMTTLDANNPFADSGKDAAKLNDASVPDASAIGCTSYCAQITAACTNDNQQYIDLGTCLKMCGNSDLANDAGDAGDFDATTGDTFACRVYHLGLALDADAAAVECPRAGPFGFGGCGTECENFCVRYTSLCGDAGYPSACVDSCNAFMNIQGGPLGIKAGANLDCREFYLENAFANDSGASGSDCTNASANGGTKCQN